MNNIRKHIIQILYLLILSALYTGCSLTKGLSPDDLVYTGTTFSVADENEAESIEAFGTRLSAIPPDGTKRGVGNIYIGLYNVYDTAPEKGFKYWVKNKLGNAPVIYEPQMIENTEAQLHYFLNGRGFFGHEVGCDTVPNDRLVSINCDVKLGKRYTIDSLVFPLDSTYVAMRLDENLQRAVLREGELYDRDRLDYERARLATLAGELGFSDFGSNSVYYYVDTAKDNNTVDVYVKVITPTDSTSFTRYILDSINIFPNFSLRDTTRIGLTRVPVSPGITIYESDHYLNHKLVDRLMLQIVGEYHNRTLEKKSINRLLDLGIFRFINIKNDVTTDGRIGHVVQNIYITPEPMQNVSAEVELNNRSGNFLGTGAALKYQHKNIFNHAERLTVTLSGEVETQFDQGSNLVNSSDFTTNVELAFPRFITPIFKIKESKNYIPRTVLSASYSAQKRIQFYSLRSLKGTFGYKWRENKKVFHEFSPAVVNQVTVTDKTPKFQDLLDADPRLASSFDDVLIAGLEYDLTYSSQATRNDRKHTYFKPQFSTSGNLISLLAGSDQNMPVEIGGVKYAQYARLTLDFRRYFPLGKADLASRMLIGTGYAFGNSQELPYIKQYFIGGSNSIRAFRLRGLGPGTTFVDPDGLTGFESQFVDQTGDIKLELNLEYRFPIFSYLKGAVFVDAGNVWLMDNPNMPEGNFSFSNFYEQLGVGTGLGLRIDFDFFLIRFDLGYPLRVPTNQGAFAWTFNSSDVLDSQKNIRFNLGIGYPF